MSRKGSFTKVCYDCSFPPYTSSRKLADSHALIASSYIAIYSIQI